MRLVDILVLAKRVNARNRVDEERQHHQTDPAEDQNWDDGPADAAGTP